MSPHAVSFKLFGSALLFSRTGTMMNQIELKREKKTALFQDIFERKQVRKTWIRFVAFAMGQYSSRY